MSAAISRNAIAQDWTSRSFTCDVWVDPPGQRWEDFVHDVDELVLVIEGEMEFVVDGEVYRPKPGEELLIPAGACPSARNAGTIPTRWLHG